MAEFNEHHHTDFSIDTPHKVCRLKHVTVKWKDRKYHYGYDQKDEKQVRFIIVSNSDG